MYRFIVFEGIDGAGTTTQAKRLAEYFKAQSLPVLQTAEPTITNPIGPLIRRILRKEEYLEQHKYPELFAVFMTLLFSADRLHHIWATIKPALKTGHVLCDRYLLSTYAYQCATDYQKKALVKELARYCLVPDLTLFLDVDAEVAFERVNKRSNELEIYEKLEFQKKVATAYQVFAQEFRFTQNIVRIDASHDEDTVADAVKKAVLLMLNTSE